MEIVELTIQASAGPSYQYFGRMSDGTLLDLKPFGNRPPKFKELQKHLFRILGSY